MCFIVEMNIDIDVLDSTVKTFFVNIEQKIHEQECLHEVHLWYNNYLYFGLGGGGQGDLILIMINHHVCEFQEAAN